MNNHNDGNHDDGNHDDGNHKDNFFDDDDHVKKMSMLFDDDAMVIEMVL